jgi:hypothetical protein
MYLKEYIDFNDIDDIHYDGCDNYPDFDGHDEFCRFLVDRDLIDSYIRNFNEVDRNWGGLRWSGYKDGYTLKDFLDDNDESFYISLVFNWDNVEGGYEFWNNINMEWIKTISK